MDAVDSSFIAGGTAPARTRRAETTISRILLLKGAMWTVGAFGAGQLLRLVSNIILTRLLAPELFGIMQIVQTLRNGAELFSDVGIGQTIIYDESANDPDFYNTAWSLQSVRGIFLWLALSSLAGPIASFYREPVLVAVIPVAVFATVLWGFSSISRPLLQKRMKFSTLTAFELTIGLTSSAVTIVFAYFSPTVWALVFGNLFAATILMIGSHFLLPGIQQRFHIVKRYARRILSFGKWIFLSSIIYFLSSNFDRLYLAKTIPLALLGIYGLARALSELASAVVMGVSGNVVFPFIASHSHMPRAELRRQLAPIRVKFLLLTGLGLSAFAATADLAIRVLYDQRYHAAAWMLPILIIGAWFSIVSSVNESTVMGLGRPNYTAFANAAKFAFLLLGLTLGVARYGVAGGVVAVAVSDLCRYVPVLVGLVRERFSFGRQDAVATLVLFGLVAFWEWLRWSAGLGTSLDTFPLDLHAILG